MNDAQLRAAYGLAMAGGDAAQGGCPEPEALRALVERSGSEDERMRALDHVMGCGSCTEDLELMRAIAGTPPQATRRRIPYRALAASVVLLAAAGASMWSLNRPADAPVLRSSGAAVTLISPVDGAASDGSLIWRSVEGAIDYRVEVFDDSGEVVLAETTQDTVLPLPPGVLAGAADGLSWWVRARLRDGSEAASDAERFDLTGR